MFKQLHIYRSRDDIGRNITEGDKALVTGWGRNTNDLAKANSDLRNKGVGSRILKKVKIPILSPEVCDNFLLDSDLQICAGGVQGILRVFKEIFL